MHDAVLIEAPIERIEADVALMQEIMRRASRIVLNADAAGTHELAPTRRSFAIRTDTRQARRQNLAAGDGPATGAARSAGGREEEKSMSVNENENDDEPWHVRRLRELEAAAPKRRKKDTFVMVPLWWAAEAAKANTISNNPGPD